MVKDVHTLVKKILFENEETRKDDFKLILAVYDELIDTSLSFKSIMENHKDLNLPSLESITRMRRKCFELYPELNDEEMAIIRNAEETQFKEYAKNGVDNF